MGDEGRGAPDGAGVVIHPLAPIVCPSSRVLILGTMPSPASREAGFYYGHPRNRFWPVMARVFGERVPQTNEERAELILTHGLALWDVLARCEIRGASDASIASPVPNDMRAVLDEAPIEAVFATGATAARLYRRLCEPATGLPVVCLPSTSPANASWSLERLVEAYQAVRLAAEGTAPETAAEGRAADGEGARGDG